MNFEWKSLRCGVLLALLLVGSATQALAVTLPLVASEQIPAAEGKVRLHSVRNGNVEIKVFVRHLATPARITPGASAFVVWVRGQAPEAMAQSLGALRVDKNLNGNITAITALQTFDLFVTTESSPLATAPSGPEVLKLTYKGK